MNIILANNIKSFRRKIALSQEELGDYLGISRAEVNYYENGKRNIPHVLLPQLANLFGVDEYDLFEEDEAINKTNIMFAFRANKLKSKDLHEIAAFKKIALNYLKLQKLTANHG